MQQLRNKLITPKNVMDIADILNNRLSEMKRQSDICVQENENKDYDKQFYETIVTYSDFRFSVYYANDTREERENIEWFKDILKNHAKEISGIGITYSLNYDRNVQHKYSQNEKKEHFRLHLDATNNSCFGDLDISYSENNSEFHTIAKELNNLISNCPERYDTTFKKKSLYRIFPSFAISAVVALIVCAAVYALTKMNALTGGFAIYLSENPIVLIAAGLGITIILGLILPNSNMGLYKRLIVDKKYDHYDTNWRVDHYENDFDRYKDQVEFAVGKFYQSDMVRAKIAKNFKLSVAVFLIAIALFAVLAVLMFVI